ncbi:hypothetical protein, partial [Amycolatopsis sp. KNN50.9b]|uniref:hypothetical protein n=1 Tax=Amycolatopsis sp. KNN50.9b TaxID=2018303 RepID=UPI000B9D05E3
MAASLLAGLLLALAVPAAAPAADGPQLTVRDSQSRTVAIDTTDPETPDLSQDGNITRSANAGGRTDLAETADAARRLRP